MTTETFEDTVLRLANEIDSDIEPGHTVRIDDDFDPEYRPAVCKKLIEHFNYKQELDVYFRKPE